MDTGFYLRKAASQAGRVGVSAGQSGYFSAPAKSLDPHLFDGQHLKPAVRNWILNTLWAFWDRRYKAARSWARVWIAGSGVTYQWAANRGNGDLDVLIGVQWPSFMAANPQFGGLTPEQAADHLDVELKSELWPRTAHTPFNGQSYEVTYFVNAAGSDIRNINAYAAYDLSSDSWTIRPPQLPADPASMYPAAYARTVATESRTASDLVDRYNALTGQLRGLRPGTPGFVNATTALDHTVAQAAAMFDDIHTGRRAAFRPGGQGYTDWHNYRWQAHKAAGTAQALAAIRGVAATAADIRATQLYGGPIETAQDRLTARAALHARGVR